MTQLRIALAQPNFHVGNIQYNLDKHINFATRARDELGADLVVFPELSLIGYPAEDLLLRNNFITEAERALEKLAATVKDIYCLVGHPYYDGHHLLNACSVIYNGKIIARGAKQYLPNYGVFDEARYFKPGNMPCVFSIKGLSIGLIICEDVWRLEPVPQTIQAGARLLIIINASPFEVTKHEQRLALLSKKAADYETPILYVNQVGGQDELVFDGGSLVLDSQGRLANCAGFFKEALLPVDINVPSLEIPLSSFHTPDQDATTYQALVLSLRDYIEKNRIPGVLVGVSGGIDSALTLAIAVDALGADRVKAVLMPSRYTADISNEDALALIANLGVQFETISIEPTYQSFLTSLEPSFLGRPANVAEENIQARCRAIILMGLSNKFGWLVLTTGNRSELAVGYCTLYGDMAGGFAVLKDVPKTLVYQLSHYRNRIKPVIPERILVRPPTAELAPNQKDEDSLPPYSILDKILEAYLNNGLSLEEIVQQGFELETVKKVINLIRFNEYKRKQSALGPHINHKSFGKDWRYPVTNGFKG